MRNRSNDPRARSLERGVSLALIVAMVFSFGWAVSTLGPAKAQGVPTIQVTTDLFTPTSYAPENLTIGANDPFKFVLVSGDFAAISSDDPQLAFNPTICFLEPDDPTTTDTREDECDMQLAGVAPGTVVTYTDKASPLNPDGFPNEGTITVSGGESPSPSDTPTGTPSTTPSASTSPTTTPSTSPTASPSVSPSDSPSATPTGSPSPTPSTSPSPTPTIHPRTLSLSLSGAVIAAGNLSSDDPGCYIGAPIDIQKKRKKGSKWKNVTRAFTDVDGDYKTDIPIKKGKYRARSPRYSSPDGLQVCARVFSASRKYRP